MLNEPDSAARNWAVSAIFWMVIGITLGIIQATEFVAPDFLHGISWIVFPRIRQAHVNGLLFGFLSMGMIAAWYYIVPRLTKSPIHSERLGNLTMIVWNLALVVGVTGLVLGYTQAREYAELIWPVDIAIMAGLLLNLYNIMRTVMARTVDHLYVSLWYIMGSLIWFPIVYAIGNVIWAPPTGSLMGLNDAVWGWFYGHNVLGLWFTTGSIPIIYYILPKETKRPLYGYRLALIAFWFLAFFYTAVGTHHILQSPVPEWLKTIAVISSMGLFIPVAAFIVNVFMTMRGTWRTLQHSVPLRFVMTGAMWYLLVSIQGSTQALRSFNVYIHFTNWTVAHAHLALLGFVGFSVWGGMYYFIPRISGHALYSERLAWTHWWMAAVSFLGFFLVLTAAGLSQSTGYSQGVPFVMVLPGIRPMLIARAVTGSGIIFSAYIFTYNIAMTLAGRHKTAEDPVPETVAAATLPAEG